MTPPQIFTIRARGSRLKVQVHVYESHRAMLVAARKNGSISDDTAAFCEGDPSAIPRGHFAVIFFCRPHLTHGIVAHEMDHAAYCLMARRGIKVVKFHSDKPTPEEEMHATITGDLVDEFHRRFSVRLHVPRGKVRT